MFSFVPFLLHKKYHLRCDFSTPFCETFGPIWQGMASDATPTRTSGSLQFKSPLMAFDTKKGLPQRPSSSSGGHSGAAAGVVGGGRMSRGSGDVESKVCWVLSKPRSLSCARLAAAEALAVYASLSRFNFYTMQLNAAWHSAQGLTPSLLYALAYTKCFVSVSIPCHTHLPRLLVHPHPAPHKPGPRRCRRSPIRPRPRGSTA
jgi:hypothetical protein